MRTTGALGILGGTFDPVHLGHVELAREVRAACEFDEVALVPAGTPPHRAAPVADARHRLAMARLAVFGMPGLGVDARETTRPGPSYTVDTLREMRADDRSRPLTLVLGADAAISLPSWHRYADIFGLAHIVVVARPGIDLASAMPSTLAVEWRRRVSTDRDALRTRPFGSIVEIAITPYPISGSAIREALAAGQLDAVRALLPPAVLAYIERHRLYQ